MSSDEESLNNDPEVSDNEKQNKEILEIGEDLQDPEEQTEEVQRDEAPEGEGGEDGDEKKKVKPKRVIRNPQPKLNEETLKGPRGITALESYFQRVKFKRKGNEDQDLNVIMKTYEYWCHRLFPKFPFDTCIERLEKLGYKRAVQTHIKRIRFDLFVEDKPIIDDSDEEANVEGFVDIQSDEINQQQNEEFDRLLGSSASVSNRAPTELTEDQLERIRLNKERAEKLKQERLKKIRDKAGESLQVSGCLPGTSGVQNITRLGQPDPIENTQSDMLSQDSSRNNYQNVEDFEDTELLFDHESNIKGKTSFTGVRIKKKPKKKAVITSDSSSSEDENMEDTVLKERSSVLSSKMSSHDTESLDIDQNSSDSGLTQKKVNKRNTIFDSDDEESDNERNQEQNDGLRLKSPSRNRGYNFEDENSVDTNQSVKKLQKQTNTLDTDESDQDLGQEVVANKEQLLHFNSNNINMDELSKDSVSHKYISQQISNLNEGNSINSDELVTVPEVTELMDIIEDESETVLKPKQVKNGLNSLQNDTENTVNSSEYNVI